MISDELAPSADEDGDMEGADARLASAQDPGGVESHAVGPLVPLGTTTDGARTVLPDHIVQAIEELIDRRLERFVRGLGRGLSYG
jgi:hypothetical protein